MNKCYKCHEIKDITELSKHDSKRYICRKCNSERIALKRNMQKLKNVPTKVSPMYPQNSNSVSPNNEPVNTPYIEKSREEAIQQLYKDREMIYKLVESKKSPLMENLEDDLQLVSELHA